MTSSVVINDAVYIFYFAWLKKDQRVLGLFFESLLRGAYYSVHYSSRSLRGAVATKQSQSEIATPFGLAMTTF
jgi:hypothetical protein